MPAAGQREQQSQAQRSGVSRDGDGQSQIRYRYDDIPRGRMKGLDHSRCEHCVWPGIRRTV